MIPSQIIASVSAASLEISSFQATLAFVMPGPGQNFSATTLTSPFHQCVAFNREAAVKPGAPLSGGRSSVVNFAEGFGSTFHKRTIATSGADTAPHSGGVFSTESGFYDFSAPSTNGLNQAGLAAHATRLVARFTNVPEGMQLYATLYPVTTCPNCGPNGNPAITGYSTTPASASSPVSPACKLAPPARSPRLQAPTPSAGAPTSRTKLPTASRPSR